MGELVNARETARKLGIASLLNGWAPGTDIEMGPDVNLCHVVAAISGVSVSHTNGNKPSLVIQRASADGNYLVNPEDCQITGVQPAPEGSMIRVDYQKFPGHEVVTRQYPAMVTTVKVNYRPG